MNTTPSMTKDDVATVTGTIMVGASWDTSTRGHGGLLGKISKRAGSDLDAVAVMFMDGVPVRMAGLDNNDPMKDGSILHSGDNQTGKGEGDDETITLHLDRIQGDIDKIVIMCAAFKAVNKKMGDSGFSGADNVEFTVYDGSTTPPSKSFRILPSLMGRENCIIVAVLERASYGWTMRKSAAKVTVEHGNRDKLLMAAVNA